MSMCMCKTNNSGNGKFKTRITLGAAMLAASMLFVSCPREVGLGGAVDTQKPVVSITAPEVDVVVKDVVTFTGKATDETALDSVSVTFQSTESTYSKTYTADLDIAAGTWTLTIDTEDATNGLPDDKYEFRVTAKDKSGKTSTAARSFQLDNSAPTILVTKPSTFGGSETIAFYKQVEIKGETYDASSVKEVRVGLYDENGTVIKEKIADGTDTWSAVFYPDDFVGTTGVKSSIAQNIFHPVYIYVTSTDKADNTSTYYYHKSDMYSILSLKKGPDEELYFPTTTQIGTLDMGRSVMTVTGVNNTSNDSVSYDVSQSELHNTKHSATNSDAFTAEKAAGTYPHLYYTEEATATIEWNSFDASAEHPSIGITSDILGSIQPPSDGSSVILDTLKVYFVKTGYAKTLEYSAGEFEASRMGEAINLTIAPNDHEIPTGTYDMYLFGKTNSGTTIGYDYDPNVTPNFTPNNGGYVKDLLLVSVNINIDDSVMYPVDQATGTVYPVPYSATTNPTGPVTADVWYVKGDFNLPVDITGLNASTVLKIKIHNASPVTAPAAGYSSLSDYNTNNSANWQQVNYTNSNQNVSLKYKVELSDLPADSPARIIYSAEEGSNTITKQIYVQRDEKAPELTISTPKSIFKDSDLTSGKIRLSGSVLDLGAGLDTLEYALLEGDGTWPTTIDWHDCTLNSSSWTADIAPGSQGKKTIKFRATDKLGNVKETLTIGQGDDTELHDIVVFYDNNPPGITVNINDGDKKCADFTLTGKAWDSDGIDEITVSSTVGGETKTWSTKTGTGVTQAVTLKADSVIDSKKDAESDVSANNWSINLKTGSANSSEGTYIDDGTKLITITIKDIAGNATSIQRTITLDTVAPVITKEDGDGFPLVDANEDGTAEARVVLKDVSPYAMLKIHASDDGTGQSGLEGVYYQLADSAPNINTDDGWVSMAQGTGGLWSANVDFSGVSADTEKTAWFMAKDRAGNRKAYPATTTDEFIVKVDQHKPVLSLVKEDTDIEIPTFTTAEADVNLFVRVTDTNPKNPVVTVQKGTDSPVTIPEGNITKDEDRSSADFSEYKVVLPFGSDFDADGTYTIKITEADLNGRPAAQVTHSILRDKTSPVITLSNYTSASWIAVDTIALSGSVKEANLAKLEAWFVYTDNDGNTETKTINDITDSVGNADSENNRAFTWRQYELPEGIYVAHVKATDKSNRTHEVTSGDIVVDKTTPVSTLTNDNLELFSTSGAALTGSGLTSGATYLANTEYTLNGVITELNLNTATLTVTKDGTAIVNQTPLTTAVDGRNTWTAATTKGPYTWSFKQTIPATNGDGTYVYTLEVADKSNNRATYSLTVKVDSTAPTLTITTPGANQSSSSASMTIRGEVEDAGAGVAQVHYAYVDAADTEMGSGDAVINGNTWYETLNFTTVGEGAFTLKVKAKDNLGNECSEVTVPFSYDQADPQLQETNIGNDSSIKNGNFTLGGKAWDSNLIKEITVSTSVGGVTKTWSNLEGEGKIKVESLITAAGITAGKKATAAEVAADNWQIAFVTGNNNVNNPNFIADGTNSFTITITDVADKTRTYNRTVTVDTTLPSLSLGTGEGFASTLVEKDVSPFVTLKVTADDPVQTKTDGSAITGVTATGLAGVYYQITANTVTTAPDFATTADEANWTAMAQASDGWTANVNFSSETGDVTKTAWIAAKDRAGNRIVYPSGDAKLNVNIDQHKPVLSVQSGATFSNQSADLEIVVRVADTNPTNPSVKVYKPKADSSAVGNVANPSTDKVDIENYSVTLLESHTTEAEPYADYKIVIPFNNNASKFNGDGYYTVLINENDEKSRAASQVAHIVLQDTSAPSLELTSNTEDVTTNNTTLIVTGTVSDANLVKVEAWLDSDSDHKEDITSAVTADGTFTWKKYDLTEGEHYVHVIATDAANLSTQVDSAKIVIDTTVPTSTLLQSAQKLYTTAGAAVPVADELTVNTTYLAKEGFTLTGVIDEAHLKSAKITVTKDDGTPDSKNLYSLTNGYINAAAAGCTYTVATKTWTCEQTAVDGTYVYKLDLEDDAGNQKSYSFTVKVDSTAPTVTVITPGANESFVTTTPVFKGTASDEGSGLKKVYYTYGDDPADPTTASSAATLSGGSWTQSMNFAGAGEGVFKFKVMAEDVLGLTSAVQTITYSYDLHDPELTETAVDETGLSTNANFSLSGKAWDSNAIDEITITGQGKTWSSKAAAGVTAPISVDISAGKKPTFAEVTADNWSINFKVGSSNSTEATYIADGTTSFTITIKDVAGKSRSYTRTVSVDTTAPVLSRLATDGFAINPVKQDESPYSKLSVQASDSGTGATGLEGVWYLISATQPDFDGTGADDTWADIVAGDNGWTSMAQGTGGWTANVDFSDTTVYSADGEQKAWFAARDRAGNRAFLSTPSTTVIDLQKPVLSVEAGSHSTDASSNIDITVRVTDTNPMAPTVKVLKPRADGTAGGTELSGAGVSISEAGIGAGYKEFTVTVPFNTSNKYTADGTYTLQINANDGNGRAADQITWTILQDKSNPEVWLTSYTSPTFTSNRTLTVTGAVRDENLSTVVAWLNDDVAGAEDITALLGQRNTDQTSPDYKKQTFTWKQYDLTEGTYVVHIKATDSAGRVNADDGLASAVVTVDLTSPDSDFKYEGAAADDKLYTNTGTPLLTEVLSAGGNYFAKTAFKLKGTITEANFQEATLAITKDAVAQPSQTITSAGDWEYTQLAEDGIYGYTLTVKDKANNVFEKSLTVTVDTSAPSVTVITPAANESFVTTGPVFKGTASDGGAGLKTIYYTLDGTEPTVGDATATPAVPASPTATLAGGSWTKTMDFTSASEGVFSFKVMAEDILGNTSPVQTVTYSYDLHDPELSETGVGDSGLSTNADFTFSGKAWDSNAIDEITITGQGKTWSSKAAGAAIAPIVVNISAGTKPTFAEVTADNWNIDFKVGSGNSTEATYIADGTTTFTITIKDVAGKSRSYTRTVTIDTAAPAITKETGDGFQNALVEQDVSPYNNLSIHASDSGAGLEGVWYQISATEPAFANAADEADWTPMAQGTAGWTARVDFSDTTVYTADGEQKAWFAAKDRVGNRTVYAAGGDTDITTYIDITKPVLSIDPATNNNFTDATDDLEIRVRVTDTNPSAPTVAVVKPKADGTAGGDTIPDADDGVSVVEDTAIDGSAGYKEYKVTIPYNTSAEYTADGTWTLKIDGTDLKGRAADQITWTVLKDQTPPEVELTSYTTATFTSNRTLTVTGTVKDDNLASVIAWINDDVAGAEDITALLGQPNTDQASPDYKKQSFTWKQYDLTEGSYVVHIKATDSASLVTTEDTAVVTVDITAPDSDFKYEGASAGDKLYTNTGSALLTDVLSAGGNYFAKTGFKLKGTITEANFQEATLAITKDAVAQPSQTITSAGDWEYTQAADDGIYGYTLTVKDKANNVFEKSLTVTVDTLAPTVLVITPAANESFVTTGPVFKGTASDEGAGLKTIYYTLDGTEPTVGDATATPAVPASPTATLAGGSWSKTMDFTGASEGVFSFKVMAEDILGNTSPVQNVTYSYDLHDPELSETGVGDNGLTTNADFSFSGKAWDSNAIDEIVISAGTKKWSNKEIDGKIYVPSIISAAGITAGTQPTFAEVTADNWGITFKVGSANSDKPTYIADGTTTFTITITDVAGKSRSYTRTVTVDTVSPTITKETGDGFQNALVEQDVSPYNRLTIHATDTGSGLEGVWYQISATEPAFADAADEADWTPMAQGTAGWTANVDFSDTTVYTANGDQKAWIAAKDRVGNRTVYAAGGDTDITTYIDIKKPVLSIDPATNDNFTDASDDLEIRVRVTDTNPSAPTVAVVKPKADGTAGGDTIPDADDGVSVIEDTAIDGSAGYKEYKVTIPYNTSAEYTADGTWTLKIDGTDLKGRTADQITWTVLKDQTPPEVELTSYTTATFTSNRTLTVTGTVKDDNLATVIAWLNDNEAGAEDITALLGAPDAADGNKQSFTWKQYDLTEGTYVVHIKATDAANLVNMSGDPAAPGLASAAITIDLTAPDSDFKYEGASADDKFYTNTGSALLTDVLSAGGTYFAKSAFKLKGTITETNFQEATLAITKDAVAQPSQTITSAGDWEYTQAADDGIYGYTLTVKDKANNVFEKSLTVTVDTLAPTVLVITPAANESFVTTDPVFKGTASDSGAGLKTIYYTLDGTEPTVGDATATPAVPASPTATLAGGSWTQTMNFTSASEGVFSFKVMSEDILGNTSAVQTVTYSYDLHDPELSETGVGDNGLTTNADFSFSGTAWDSNAIDEILISTGTKKWSNKEVDGKIYVPSIISAAGITAGTKPTFAEVTADNWGITFKVGSANSDKPTYIADGTTTFTITITDVAGKSRSYTRTVTVDTTTPVITEETGDGFQNALVKQDESPYNKLTIHASDTGSGATGLDGVFYQVAATKPDFDDAADEADWTPMAQGTGGAWSANVDFSDTSVYAANGEQLAWIAAKDRAGNRVVYNNSISTFIDIMKPVLSIEKIDPSAEIPTFTDAITDLEFRVRVTDTNPLAPKIAVKDKDNNTIADAGISIVEDTAVDGSAGYKDWKVTVPFNSQASKYTTDGDYTFTIEGKDTKDRVADPKIHTILRDTTVPEVTVAITQSGTTFGYTNQGTITATGTVSDANLTEVQAVLIKNEVVDTTTQETITSSLGSGGTFTWKKYELDDGKYKVRVSGKDRADLVGYGLSGEVIVDKTAPDTSFTWDTTGGVKLYDNTGAEVTTLTTGGSYMAKSAFTLKGVVSEANLKKVDYTTSKDGETPAGENIYSDDGLPIVNSNRYDISTDTWNIVQAATDGTYVYTVKIEDKAGNRSEQSITILVDTAAPELVITKPAEDEQLEQGKFKFAGTVSDQGAGVSTVTYDLKNAGVSISSGDATRTGGSWSINGTDGTGLVLGAEGELEISVTATDKLGQSTIETTRFYYDQGAPTLEETEVGVGSLITGAAFTLKGTASDSNALANYDSATSTAAGAINISTGTGPEKVDYGNVDVTGLTTATATGNWEKTFTPGTGSGQLADGTYTFYIKATDVSGRDTTVQRTVVIDTTAPEINNIDGKDAYITQSASFNWFNSGTISIGAKVTDNRAGGVASVEYAVISNPSAEPDASAWGNAQYEGIDITWKSMTKSGSNYTANAEVEDGMNYIVIRAKDAAGNVKYTTQEPANVDTCEPSLVGAYEERACTTAVLTKITNAADAFNVFIKVEDPDANDETQEGSGATSVVAKIGNKSFTSGTISTTNVASNVFRLSLSVDALLAAGGSDNTPKTVYVKITDRAGNESSATSLFTLQFDTIGPDSAFISPADGTTVNKKISINGKSNDLGGLDSVSLFYLYNDTDMDHKQQIGETKTGMDAANWSYTFDTAPLLNHVLAAGEQSDLTLIAEATDSAGNTRYETITLRVDQSEDIPEVTITQPETLAGMSSSTPVWLKGNNRITGTISDDDGVSSLKISTDNGTSWTNIPVSGGYFQATLSIDDTYTVLFRVTDTAEGVFTSGETGLTALKMRDSSDPAVYSTDGKLYLTVDTENPQMLPTRYALDGTSTTASDWTMSLLAETTFGGTSNTQYTIKQYAYDENGIKKVEVSIDGGTFVEATKQASDTTVDAGDTYTAYTYTVDTTSLETSLNHTVKVKVTDNADMTNELSSSFKVDNDEPTVTLGSHAEEERVHGTLFVSGTTQDAPLYGPATSMLYKVTLTPDVPTDWTTTLTTSADYGAHTVTGNLGSWRIYFDDDINNLDGYTHDRALKKVLVQLKSSELEISTQNNPIGAVVWKTAGNDASGVHHNAQDLYTSLTMMYLHMKATDAYGNVAYFVRALELDPQGDIPTISVAYPSITGYGWKNGSNVIYTADKLPNVGDSVYSDIANMETAAGTISAINRTAKTITYNGTTYTNYGGETVQGGIVRVQGTADGQNAIKGIFMQIDPAYNATTGFNWDASGNALMPNGAKLSTRYTIEPFFAGSGEYGIKIGEGVSWSASLNRNNEFNGASGSQSHIGIRLYAVDTQNNVNPLNVTDDIIITIDSDSPLIGSSEELYLYQYENNANGTGIVVASQKYEDDMWLKGEWWIQGSVEDASGINGDLVNVQKQNGTTFSDYTYTKTVKSWTTQSTSGYVIKFKIGSAAAGEFGKLVYQISATDKDTGSAKSVEKLISINFDNAAPVLAGTNHEDYNINHEVVQSNGFYTLGSSVTETGTDTASQSGFERLALYFVRPGTTEGTSTLYDTYFLKSSANNHMQLSTLTYSEGLYWKSKQVARDPNNLSAMTLYDVSADPNIHKGGLVKIGGTIYVISSVSGTSITVKGSPAIANTSTMKEYVEFAMGAIVVDHALTEGNGTSENLVDGYYTDVVNDDGDNIVERVTTQGYTSFWEANICSRNIPDGAIDIHYVAFDKAGNYAIGVVASNAAAQYKGHETPADILYDYDAANLTRVANNAPRLAGVMYGTDDDGSGTVEDDEMHSDLFAISTTATGTTEGYINSGLRTSYLMGTKNSVSVIKIKGATRIQPEIVGGNGTLGYSWTVTQKDAASPYYSIGYKALSATGSDYSATGAAAEIKDVSINLSVKDLLKNDGNNHTLYDGVNQLFSFTIWDSTDGMTPGTNSQKATIEMVADLDLQDDTPPNTYIKPFYWKSKSDNSVYSKTENGKSSLMGHIDLKADLPTASFSQASGVNDTDDKVSGTIVIEGTAQDNVLLKDLYVQIYTGTTASPTEAFGFGSLSKVGGTGTLKNFYKVAHNNNGTWESYGTNLANGWTFSVDAASETFSQEEGHTIAWKLVLDTEELTSAALSDVKVVVRAQDQGAPELNGETISYSPNTSAAANTTPTAGDTTATQTNYNKFDVVPYITGVSTRLSSLKKNNPTIYNRTSLGKYSVASGETVIFTGFNLEGAKVSYSGDGGTSASTTAKSASDVNEYYRNRGTSFVAWTIPSAANSGEIKLTVNSISSLNNINNNNAKGAAVDEDGNAVVLSTANYDSYAYNRQPNGDSNQYLTDDVFFDVWSINTKAAVAHDGGAINEPVMKINQKDGTIGLAFASGSDTFCMPSGTGGNSYTDWSRNYTEFSNIALYYDSLGYAWAIGIGLDTNADQGGYGGRMALMSSRWGQGQSHTTTGDNFNVSNKIRLESIGLPETAYAFGVQKANYQLDPKRFKSTTLAVTDHTSNGTTTRGVYLAYYDRLTGQIRFRSGSTTSNTKGNFNQFIDNYGLHDKYTSNGYGGTTHTGMRTEYVGDAPNNQNWEQHMCFEPEASAYSLIAGAESTVTSNSSTTGFTAGSYVALDVIPGSTVGDDVVLVVFSDGSDLWYVTRKGRVGNDDNVKKGSTSGAWSQPVMVFEGIGQDCTVKAGPDGSVHIACYDNSEGSLKYAYLAPGADAADAAGNSLFKTATVDGYGIAGSHISIDVVKEGSSYIPYLSYYVPSIQKVKMAYLTDATALTSTVEGALDGADDNDSYTGVWECSIVPTASKVNDDNTSIGFWKKADNTAQAIRSNMTASAGTDSGNCNGNGTTNPAIAYGTTENTSGYIEVVQKK